MIICLEQGADLHMAQLMATATLASVKSRLVLPFWYQLTRVVLDKGPLNGCVCVYVPAVTCLAAIVFFLIFCVIRMLAYCVNVLKVASIDGLTPFLVACRCSFLLWQINFFFVSAADPTGCQSLYDLSNCCLFIRLFMHACSAEAISD